MTEKKQVLRRCTGCMQHFEKQSLLRVLRTPEGEVVIDKSGRQNGRGAYLCRRKACFSKLRKNHRLEQSLGVPIPEDVYAALEALCDAEG